MVPFLFGYDFYFIWSAGALVHRGLNPYDMELYRAQLAAIGWPATETPLPHPHPINTVWLYWLLALLPFKVSLVVWSVVSLAIIVWCAVSVAKTLECRDALSLRMIAFAAVLFPPTLGHLIWGQMNVMILAGLVIFARYWRDKSYCRAGVGLSLTLFKPHILIPFFVVLTVWELSHRRIALLAGCGIGLALQIAASLVVAPDCLVWYSDAFDGISSQLLRVCGATVAQQVECACRVMYFKPTLLVMGSLVAIWLVRRLGYSLESMLCVVVPLSVCVAPYAWMHYFVVLVPCFVWLLGRFGTYVSESRLLYAITGVAAVCLPLILDAHLQIVWVAFSWAVLLAAVTLMWRSRGAIGVKL